MNDESINLLIDKLLLKDQCNKMETFLLFLIISLLLVIVFFPIFNIHQTLEAKKIHRIIVGCSVEMKNKTSNEIRVVSVVDTYKEKYVKMDVEMLGEICCWRHRSVRLIEGKDEWKTHYVVKQGNIHEAKKILENIEKGGSSNATKYNFQKDIDINDLVILNTFYNDHYQKFQKQCRYNNQNLALKFDQI
jgi:hypothetical protein